ncbi:NAD(P)-dependent alcohol dehydrogenase [Burkholderia ubonensis]|uniref:Alcohol dehydrogenase n=1 Tax=Burkholderia ubonensis TaxID=101571 RepID=A0A1R1J2L3_9BURK|nr:NAD(P)-dependent alcohol dehydrogenase [Burkholderia ubonensis]OMG69565.1 alcohol dehydrogenase [Burkholderia ubonensis]
MSQTGFRDIVAAVTRTKGAPFVLEPARLRAPVDDEVLVRIVAAGMCHTDLIIRDQYYPVPLPAVLGHEGAGIVEAVGPRVGSLAPGDHVVLTYGHCGHCATCDAGHPSYCADFYAQNFGGCGHDGQCAITTPDGTPIHDHFFSQSSFATFALTRERSAIKVPRHAPLRLLGPLGCGIQTGAGAVIHSLKVAPGSRFLVLGAGAVGMSAVLAARLSGAATIIAVDIVPGRLALAREIGATHALDSRESGWVDAVRAITGGGAGFALETTGRPEMLAQGVSALAPLGVLGVVGASRQHTKAAFDLNDLMIAGKRIQGICEGDSVPRRFIPELVQLHLQGRFAFDKLVKFYPFADINRAAADSEAGTTLKPILLIDNHV